MLEVVYVRKNSELNPSSISSDETYCSEGETTDKGNVAIFKVKAETKMKNEDLQSSFDE